MNVNYFFVTMHTSIKESLDRANIDLNDVKKWLIHQANGKLYTAILKRLTISWLGSIL